MVIYITPENFTGPVGMMQYANYVSDYIYGPVMSLVIFAVMFISLKRYSTGRAFLAASWVAMVMTAFLFYLGMVPGQWFYGWIVIACLSIAFASQLD